MNIAEKFYFYLLDSLSDEIKIDINEFKKIYPFVSGVCCLHYSKQPQSNVYRYVEAMNNNLCKLKREKVKEVLLSFRRTLQENARSECIESGHPTFDYI